MKNLILILTSIAMFSCKPKNNNTANTFSKKDTIPLKEICKNFFENEAKTMDDIETLNLDSIKVLSYKRINSTTAKANIIIMGRMNVPPLPPHLQPKEPCNPCGYSNTINWDFTLDNNNWNAKPMGWIR